MFIPPSKPQQYQFDSDEEFEAAVALHKDQCRNANILNVMLAAQVCVLLASALLFIAWFLTGWIGVAVLIAVVFSEIAVFQILKRWGHADKT
ncbi:hypothetical protein RZ532_01090 [Nitratireductor aquimarinus]|uniref:hypothetical protein n=1 Tax=Nitratireductor aquimarinus TaxID=889300 RepID=UPI002935AFD9|nr:hypothetical protein [Nitratireductor aquimarinus]MDV2964556.1 hypothetical protein [Nitratireductor aquimarinus]